MKTLETLIALQIALQLLIALNIFYALVVLNNIRALIAQKEGNKS